MRIKTLDWLRGLMALAIMFFHIKIFMFSPAESSHILGKLGVYAVCIFFILSGLTIAYVYNKNMSSRKGLFTFYIKRIFRLYPLMILATIITGAYMYLQKTLIMEIFLLNLTLLFSFFKPEAYIVTGAWSIGIEVVHYILAPILILIYNKSLKCGNILLLISAIIGGYFSFVILNPLATLNSQWNTYINPFNNLWLFDLGIAIFYNFKDRKLNQILVRTMLICSSLLFIFYPVYGDLINMVTGINRLIFSLLSTIIVISTFKLEIDLPRLVEKFLNYIGEGCYGIYIIHPIVIGVFNMINLNKYLEVVLIVILTIILSVISFRLFEKRLVKVGNNILNRNNKKWK